MMRPIVGTEALAAGSASRRALVSRYDAIYRNVYLANGVELTAAHRAEATWAVFRAAGDIGRTVGCRWIWHALDVSAVDIAPLLQRHPGVRGLVQLRDVLELMDGGAESPQERRTRLVLVDAGLPRPETQIVVRGNFGGRRYARIDMGYREFKVGVEYEGAQHWTDPRVRANDIDRYAELAALGWRIIRVGADLLDRRPWVIVARETRVCVA